MLHFSLHRYLYFILPFSSFLHISKHRGQHLQRLIIMSYSYYLAVFHYLSGEHYRLGQLSRASWLQGDHGTYVAFRERDTPASLYFGNVSRQLFSRRVIIYGSQFFLLMFLHMSVTVLVILHTCKLFALFVSSTHFHFIFSRSHSLPSPTVIHGTQSSCTLSSRQ